MKEPNKNSEREREKKKHVDRKRENLEDFFFNLDSELSLLGIDFYPRICV